MTLLAFRGFIIEEEGTQEHAGIISNCATPICAFSSKFRKMDNAYRDCNVYQSERGTGTTEAASSKRRCLPPLPTRAQNPNSYGQSWFFSQHTMRLAVC